MNIFLILAIVFFGIVLAVVGWLKNLADKLKDGEGETPPVFYNFKKKLLPLLIACWLLVIILFLIFGWKWLWVIGVWASVTTIMLWPCARGLGLSYFSYRRPFFIIGVLSMAALPALGFLFDYLPKDTSRIWALLITVGALTTFSIIAGVKRAIGSPPHMLFRPDILFGDGRVLATGVISLGLAMRFLFDGGLPIPKGNWYGLLLAIGFGILQIIPLRGMLKLRLRMARMLEGGFGGWWWVFLREAYFLLAALAILYGFHNVLMGTTPFIDWTLPGLNPENWDSMGRPALILMIISALVFIFIRGAYKKRVCGDPFIKETVAQSWIKAFLFLVSVIPFFYGFAHIMEAHGGDFPRPFPSDPLLLWIGMGLLLWGVLMESVFRIIVQQTQQQAIVEHMVAVILSRVSDEERKKLMQNMMSALSAIEENRRQKFVKSILSGLTFVPESIREKIIATRTQVLAELPEHQRKAIIKSMDTVMLAMSTTRSTT